jgi:hypothetical protein
MSALVIESPERSSSTVVYLFSRAVSCVDLSFAAWDQTIDPGTTFLELHLEGKVLGRYPVVDSTAPASRQGTARVASAYPGGGEETRATGGSVAIDELTPYGRTAGRFDLAFGDRPLRGQFAAVFCPSGHEP